MQISVEKRALYQQSQLDGPSPDTAESMVETRTVPTHIRRAAVPSVLRHDLQLQLVRGMPVVKRCRFKITGVGTNGILECKNEHVRPTVE
jgi:hypothetical protein